MSGRAAPPEADDVATLARIASGDAGAFAEFYDRHSAMLYSLAMGILRDAHEAEEVLQDAFVSIWERAGSYDTALGKPLSWALTLTRNKAIDRLRSSQRRHRLVAEATHEIEAQLHAASASTDRAAMAGDVTTLMRHALATLPAEQRRAIELAFLGGLTHAEIASQSGEPLGTVKARIRRGMLTLRDALEHQL